LYIINVADSVLSLTAIMQITGGVIYKLLCNFLILLLKVSFFMFVIYIAFLLKF